MGTSHNELTGGITPYSQFKMASEFLPLLVGRCSPLPCSNPLLASTVVHVTAISDLLGSAYRNINALGDQCTSAPPKSGCPLLLPFFISVSIRRLKACLVFAGPKGH